MGFFIVLHTFTLYKTNKNIDEGFEKVEETIKKLIKKFIEANLIIVLLIQ